MGQRTMLMTRLTKLMTWLTKLRSPPTKLVRALTKLMTRLTKLRSAPMKPVRAPMKLGRPAPGLDPGFHEGRGCTDVLHGGADEARGRADEPRRCPDQLHSCRDELHPSGNPRDGGQREDQLVPCSRPMNVPKKQSEPCAERDVSPTSVVDGANMFIPTGDALEGVTDAWRSDRVRRPTTSSSRADAMQPAADGPTRSAERDAQRTRLREPGDREGRA
jgi:hypothetical protein